MTRFQMFCWIAQLLQRYGILLFPLVSHQVTRDLLHWTARKTSQGIVYLITSQFMADRSPPLVTRTTLETYEKLLRELTEQNRKQAEYISRMSDEIHVIHDFMKTTPGRETI